jgi:hypothetical protein
MPGDGRHTASWRTFLLDILDRKIRQMHAALDEMATADLSAIKARIDEDSSYFCTQAAAE